MENKTNSVNLEKLLKELEEESSLPENTGTTNLLSGLTEDQMAQIKAILNNNAKEVKEAPTDYKDNFSFPKEDEQEELKSSEFDPDEETRKFEEEYTRRNQASTEFSKMYDDAFDTLNEELSLGVKYKAKIVNITVENSNYNSIIVSYEVNDNNIIRHVVDKYSFGGDYDKLAMNNLVVFLTSIDGFYKNDIVAFTVDEMAEQMKFLIGANVILTQYENTKGYRRNQVTVLGTFDRLRRKMVDD